MLICIAGVCHDDPKGKANLKAWLHKLSAAYNEPPAFIGAEYDKEKFAELKKQKPLLRQKMQSYGPAASPDLLDALADCLAYEPDAAAEVFPNVERLWLDTGIPSTTNNVYNTRGNRYQTILESKNVLFPAETATVLSLMSEAAWDHFDPQRRQFPDPADAVRSQTFACRVLGRIKRGSGRWAIAVVGAYHASASIPESMRSRLTAAAIECKAHLIKPNGPVPA